MKRNPGKDFCLMKWLVVFVATFFTAYPVVELTRCILQYNVLPETYPPGYPADLFIVELCIIWIGYLFVPFFILLVFRLLERIINSYKTIKPPSN